jgi:two-component system, cell cycle sensor histidine kinase PleC
MTVNASMPNQEDCERAYRARLKDEPLPGAVIDCATARVVAANAGGLSALGLSPADRLPAHLDSAMPALVALRDLQRMQLDHPKRKTLVFWRQGRTSTRLCDVSAADGCSSTHLMVLFCPDSEMAEAADSGHPKVAATAANDDSPARIARDDSETLKEIARRIREGQNVRIFASEPDSDLLPSLAPPIGAAASHGTTSADIGPLPWDAPRDRPAPAVQPHPILPKLSTDDIAKLAHELKTPLTAIASAAEIMRDERLGTMGNATYLGYAADIHGSAIHALAVISELLATGSGDPNGLESKNAFDLTELAATTVSALQPLAMRRDLTLRLDGEHSLMPVRANATAIRQILLNLLTNALKFTPPGGDVRVVTGYLEDGAVFLVVRDTGDGMSDAALAQAFNDNKVNSTGRPGGGQGIGLPLVRRLAVENGCEFEIDSAPGRGTVVLVAFPKDLVGAR